MIQDCLEIMFVIYDFEIHKNAFSMDIRYNNFI